MNSVRTLLCLVIMLCLAACSKQSKSVPLHKYTSSRYGFSVTVPGDPEDHGGSFRFYSADRNSVLLEIEVTQLRPPYSEMPADSNLDVYQRAYKGEPGAVVAVKSIALQDAPGREFDITSGPRAPSRNRVYVANKTYYFVEFNPNTPGAAELANSFQFEFPVQ
jgi:hypothetical protein